MRLTVYIPQGLKDWLRHRAIDEHKDVGHLVTEAVQLLEQDRLERDRKQHRRR